MSATVAQQRPSVVPSLSNWQVGRALRAFWTTLRSDERRRLLAYTMLPTLSRFALLAGFGVTMKAIFAVGSEPLPPETLRLYGGSVLGVLLLAAALQYLQQRSLARIHFDLRSVARRVIGRELARLGREPVTNEKDAKARRAAYLEYERDFARGVGSGLATSVELLAGFLLVSLILAAITLVLPVAGALLAVVGVAVLAFLRMRVRRPKDGGTTSDRAKRERRNSLLDLLSGTDGTAVLPLYEENELDRAQEGKKLAERQRESRIAVFSNVVSAFVLTLCFFLVAGRGIRSPDPVHLLLFVIALRLFAMQGRALLKQWAEILRKKQFLYAFALILTGRDGFARALRKRPTA